MKMSAFNSGFTGTMGNVSMLETNAIYWKRRSNNGDVGTLSMNIRSAGHMLYYTHVFSIWTDDSRSSDRIMCDEKVICCQTFVGSFFSICFVHTDFLSTIESNYLCVLLQITSPWSFLKLTFQTKIRIQIQVLSVHQRIIEGFISRCCRLWLYSKVAVKMAC